MSKTGGNPVLSRADFRPLEGGATGRGLTYDDVLRKTLLCLAVLGVGAVFGWMNPGLYLVGTIVGFALAMVNIFKKRVSPPLILAYSGFEGLALGAISGKLDSMYPGIAVQAVVGSLAVFSVALFLFRSGKVRATPKAVRFLIYAMIGLIVYSLINIVLMATGVLKNQWGMDGIEVLGIPLGAIIGVVAIGMAGFSLIVDFTEIEDAIRDGADEKHSWTAAFGLMVTLVWLYMEILRLLAILRGDD